MAPQQDVILLDGAMGTALRQRGVAVPDHRTSIWSALALTTVPDAVVQLHRDYIRAGANVITINNYAVTPASLTRARMDSRLEELTITACRLAKRAREGENSDVKIAGSLPPLNTSFRPDLVAPCEQNLSTYRMLAGLLAPHVDILLCETMTTAVEARAAAQAGMDVGKPVWVSWTLSDDPIRLRGGETVAEAVAALDDLDVSAHLFNCSSSGAVSAALPLLRKHTVKPIGAYANPFRQEPLDGTYATDTPNWLDPETYAVTAARWIKAGATIIGGCCGTNPAYVEALDRMRNDARRPPNRRGEGAQHANRT